MTNKVEVQTMHRYSGITTFQYSEFYGGKYILKNPRDINFIVKGCLIIETNYTIKLEISFT